MARKKRMPFVQFFSKLEADLREFEKQARKPMTPKENRLFKIRQAKHWLAGFKEIEYRIRLSLAMKLTDDERRRAENLLSANKDMLKECRVKLREFEAR
jgi:hypothetical protein